MSKKVAIILTIVECAVSVASLILKLYNDKQKQKQKEALEQLKAV